MALQADTLIVTPEVYLALERASDTKHEYDRGEMIPMTGASRRHNLLVMAIAASFYAQLRGGPCEVYASDMRIKIEATGRFTYPDVSVACGEPRFEDDFIDTLLTPTVIVEVLSKSTMAYDRGDKFEHYRTIDSLSDYLMVAQDKYLVEHFARQPDNFWLFSETRALEQRVVIESINCVLSMQELYERIQFDSEE